MARYQVRIVNTEGPDAGIGGLHPEIIAETNNRREAEDIASREATRFEAGCAVVDTVSMRIDWGTHPTLPAPAEYITDYDGKVV